MSGPENAPGWYQRFKLAVKKMKNETLAVYYAVQDPEVGWLPRTLAIIAVAYVVSPLDLIPDFIPILGLIDDLIILPALLWLAVTLIPDDVMERAREKAATHPMRLSSNWIAAIVFFIVWNLCFAALAWLGIQYFGTERAKEMQWWIVGSTVAFAIVCEGIWAWLRIKTERRRAAGAGAAAGVVADEEEGSIQEALLPEP